MLPEYYLNVNSCYDGQMTREVAPFSGLFEREL
jgi:hypothetical protein